MSLFSRKKDEPKAVKPTALVIGEALIDVVRRPDGTVAEYPGGSPASVSLTLGRLGREVRLLTWIGEDAYGQMIRKWLAGSNVELEPLSTGASQTSIATATLNDEGVADYSFEIEWLLPDAVTVPTEAVVVHSGSIAATLEPGSQKVLELLKSARLSATITYDPNVRPTLMGTPAQARTHIEGLVRLADVIKVSDEDLTWLYPKKSPEQAAADWHAFAGALVVLTEGGDGATAWTQSGTVHVKAPSVKVVDTVGAGDSFMGSLIDGLWEEKLLGADQREDLRGIEPEAMQRVLNECVQVAAITVSRAGANPPRRSELSRLPHA